MKDQKTLEETVVSLLRDKGFTLTTAESCTAGLLSGRIMNVAGASWVYEEGYITYSNRAKEKLLGVSNKTLETYGAVSEETAREMAEGAAASAGANAALSVTGIAGPDGGTDEKPVGLIYIGCTLNGRTEIERHIFPSDRNTNRALAVEAALVLLNRMLEKLS